MPWLPLACVLSIPDALQVEPTQAPAEAPEPADPAAMLAWMVAHDPLVRRPRVPTSPSEALVPFVDVASRAEPKAGDWWALEEARPGTVSVPLAAGARLAALETALGDPELALAWALPLVQPPPAAADLTRPPLAWMSDGGADRLLGIVERQVLLGWLGGPGIDLGPVAAALATPTYDRLAVTPAGRLLLARAVGVHDEAAGAEGFSWLTEATVLAAMDVAADRDAEQARLKTLKADVAARYGFPADPLPALLDGAEARLVRDAGADRSTGAALLAQAARRWAGRCPDRPCNGFDRARAMAAAARWDPAVAALSEAWLVVAAKAAVDRLDVAWDTPVFALAVDDLVEALLGLDARGMDRSVLRHTRPDASLQLTLTRAAGGGDLTSREDLFRALGARLATLADAAAARAPAELKEPLNRIARRARE